MNDYRFKFMRGLFIPTICILALCPYGVSEGQTSGIALELVGQIGGYIEDVTVDGDYAFVGEGQRLVVLNVSDPYNPYIIGTSKPFQSFVEGVATDESVAFVTAGPAGVYSLDISNPSEPSVLESYDTPGYAEACAIHGQYVFVADGPYGLRILSIANPGQTIEVGFAYPMNYIFDVAVDGQYAYLAAAGAGLLIVDISDPVNPIELGSYDTPGYAYGVDVSGKTVFVADAWEGLCVLDVTNPVQPTRTAHYGTPGWAFGVFVLGDRAFIADAFAGLQIFDVSDPPHPITLGDYEIPGGHSGKVFVAGNTAYVADRDAGLRMFDVSDPLNLSQTGLYVPIRDVLNLAVSGHYVYIAEANYGLRVVDISDAAHPVEVGRYYTGSFANGVDVVGNYVHLSNERYVAEHGLYIIDVSDPTHPNKVGDTQHLDNGYKCLVVSNGIAYLPDEGGLEVVDVSNPYSPSLLGYIHLAGEDWDFVSRIDVVGNLAFATGKGGLNIVDVSDPSSPTLLSHYDAEGDFSVAAVGSMAYLAGDPALTIIDASDPVHPVEITKYYLPKRITSVNVANNIAYLTSGSSGLCGIDVADPSNLTQLFSFDTPGEAISSVTDGSYVYIADMHGGLLILRMADGNLSTESIKAKIETSDSIPLGGVVPDRSQMLILEGRILSPHHKAQRNLEQSDFASRLQLPDLKSNTVRSESTCVVNSTGDSGPGTLRECMDNAGSGVTVSFDTSVFPPASPVTIAVQTGLPSLSAGSVTIDASDAGVVLDGSQMIEDGDALYISSENNVIRGLQIVNFPAGAISIVEGGNGNILGGNRSIGSGPMGQGNLISGSGGGNIGIQGNSNIIIGNYIGTDVKGLRAFDNIYEQGIFCHGIFITDCSHNKIGGSLPGERNVISGNQGEGICMHRTHSNTVVGNYIGTDASGTKGIGNARCGVDIVLGSSNNVVKGNLISGGNTKGIEIVDLGSSYNTVVGNLIGTDVSGMNPLPNRNNGVFIGSDSRFNRIGGTLLDERNVLSGNYEQGISLSGTGHLVLGNYIGTSIEGTKAIANRLSGINMGGNHCFIGGTANTERNIISGNYEGGISAGGGERNFIIGNFIGTDVNGTTSLPNKTVGVYVRNSSYYYLQDNIISGNAGSGIELVEKSNNNIFRANRIGVASDGISHLPNGLNGILIEAASNLIGGSYPGDGNIIARNTDSGVQIKGFPYNTILHNSIYSNSGKGIESIEGGNNDLPTPIISSASFTGVSGTACTDCIVQIFSDEVDEGQIFEGDAVADDSGNWTLPGFVNGPHVTATATDSAGNTSEFSAFAVPKGEGDINGDGYINLEDAVLVLRILADFHSSEAVIREADVNGDNLIGVEEASYILNMVSE